MRQLSLFEQRQIKHPDDSDETHVRALAAEIADDLELAPPVDLDLVASYQGVSRVVAEDIPWAGCLVCDGGELVIKVRASDSPGRQRFTIPHEIAHTFFPGFQYATRYRCEPAGGAPARKPSLEWLCDVGAAELLFPRRCFRRDVDESEFGLAAVEELAGRYDASLEATAHQYVETASGALLLLTLEPRLKPTQRRDRSAEPALRVTGVHPKGRWPFVPRHKSATPGGVLARALAGEEIDQTADIIGLASQPLAGVEVSARPYPYTDHRGVEHQRVVALIRRRRR